MYLAGLGAQTVEVVAPEGRVLAKPPAETRVVVQQFDQAGPGEGEQKRRQEEVLMISSTKASALTWYRVSTWCVSSIRRGLGRAGYPTKKT